MNRKAFTFVSTHRSSCSRNCNHGQSISIDSISAFIVNQGINCFRTSANAVISGMQYPWKIVPEKVHSRQNMLSCLQCEKSFKTKTDVKIHVRVHTGERPFVCNQCGNTFSQRPALVNHRTIHIDVRPFSCDQCKRSFKRLDSLKGQTKEKP